MIIERNRFQELRAVHMEKAVMRMQERFQMHIEGKGSNANPGGRKLRYFRTAARGSRPYGNVFILFETSESPSAKVLCVSAKSSDGFKDWILELSVLPEFDKQPLDIVYDTYARAEAALGWLITSAGISGNEVAGYQIWYTARVKIVLDGALVLIYNEPVKIIYLEAKRPVADG